jgi:methanogenic corrinoid protein MtbC1
MSDLNRNADMASQDDKLVPISVVEQETGILKETLRVWEKRYGFPRPLRDQHGDRIYPLHQVEKLRIVREMLDAGMRPGKIFSGGNPQLQLHQPSDDGVLVRLSRYESMLNLLRRQRVDEFRDILQHRIHSLGLPRFVKEVLAPLTQAVGDAWQRGELSVAGEHLFTHQVNLVMYGALAALRFAPQHPKVVVATLTGEPHYLGALMVEAVLSAHQVKCLQLGANTPATEVVEATRDGAADVVALSFTQACSAQGMTETITDLRAALPPQVTLWVGGSGINYLKDLPEGVQAIDSLTGLEQLVVQWRKKHASVRTLPKAGRS